MADTQRIEVRLLGGLHVTRSDGSLVAEEEWRTAKSVDLLRLLALDAGRPVPVPAILDRFWPGVEAPRAKASLRTALVHLRKAVGHRHLERTRTGVLLQDAWVDVVAYRMLAREARASVRRGRHAELVRIARESEALYTGDFEAHDATAPWVRGERAALVGLRKNLLGDAAESAVELRWLRDAVDFAETAISLDPGLERAHRALMRAYAGLGETERALRAYDRCRRHLVEELGADPSALTSSVHLEILSGPAPSVPATRRLVGREREVGALVDALEVSVRTTGPTLIWVTGAPGSGRDAVLDAALHQVDAAVRDRIVPCSSEQERRAATANVRAAVSSLAGGGGALPTIVVVATAPLTQPWDLEQVVRGSGFPVREVLVPPLPTAELTELAEAVLHGPVSPGLVRQLEDLCGGRAGRAVRLLRRWSALGAVVWTSAGLELVSTDAGWEEEHSFGRVLRELQRQLSPEQFELMQVIALVQRPVTAAELARLHGPSQDPASLAGVERSEVQPLLDRLADLGVLRSGHQGHEFRDARLRDATATWTRPSVRRRLDGRLLASGVIPPQVRPDRVDRPGVAAGLPYR